MFDLIVIGAGSGGLAAAKRAALADLSVCLIESDSFGGTCVSTGCVPKKLWHGISMAHHHLDVAKSHGWSFSEPLFDWSFIQPRLMDFIRSLNNRHETRCRDMGIHIVRGHAYFLSPNEIMVNNTTIKGNRILISVGAKAQRIQIPGHEFCDTSHEFFDWITQPSSVVLWGGGYISVELASILNALGCNVDVIIRQPYVLRGFDQEMREFLQDQYITHGIKFHTEQSIASIKKDNQQLMVTLDNGTLIQTDRVIQALGRIPNTSQLNCENIGIELSSNGAIIVNDSYQTSLPNVSAIGDCIDRIQLTPVAIAQAREWVDRVLVNQTFNVDYSIIPTAIFSHPEAATVGLTEAQAREQYDNVTVKTLTFTPLTSSLVQGRKDPVWIKLVFEGQNERVRGIHMVCDGASELIQCLAIAVQHGICKSDLDLTMALHPSIAEELVTIY